MRFLICDIRIIWTLLFLSLFSLLLANDGTMETGLYMMLYRAFQISYKSLNIPPARIEISFTTLLSCIHYSGKGSVTLIAYGIESAQERNLLPKYKDIGRLQPLLYALFKFPPAGYGSK